MLIRALFLSCAWLSLTAQAQSPSESLSANGRYRVYEAPSDNGVVLMLADREKTGAKVLVQLPGDNQLPVWSPDNNFVAFCATYRQRHFITVTDLTGHSWKVMEIYGRCSAPAWSPDSVQLAFGSQTKHGDYDVFIATAGGTEHRNLSNRRDSDEANPVWSVPDKAMQFTATPRSTVLPINTH